MRTEVAVIGGGQAGLATARCLQRHGVEPVVLDACSRTGDSWRQRYDSLRLFTPAQYDGLPDLAFPAARDTYPTKDDVAAYLEWYAEHFAVDVRHGVRVHGLTHDADAARFSVATDAGSWEATCVVVATGALQRPWRPDVADRLSPSVRQMHSADYRRPADVVGDEVLVVGAGNSGAQIAEELVAAGLDVTVSADVLPRRFPQRFLGRDVFWWLDRLGVLDRERGPHESADATVGSIPLIGSRLPGLLRSGRIRRARRIVDVDDASLTDADGRVVRPTTVIWATGYRNDFSWIDVPHALDECGRPQQTRGMADLVAGLAFVGLPGLHTKGSAFLGFVGRDAEHVATELAAIALA